MTAPADLTIDDARLALERYVRTTRWGWRGLSNRLDIVSLERSGAFDVVLQSFTETRTVESAFEPYSGQSIDGPERGRAPGPWEITQQLPPMFILEEKRIVRIPHTEVVRSCHVCQGGGRITCSKCSGDGRVSCGWCGGSGRKTEHRTTTRTDSQGNTTTETESYTVSCGNCGGDGQIQCSDCSGSGLVTCPACRGHGQCCYFQQMHVLFATRTNSFQIEDTELPNELVGEADGIAIHQEEGAELEAGNTEGGGGGPYRGGSVRVNARVAAATNQLLSSHQLNAGQRLHRQRLVVRAVPVWEARYRWRKEERKFWVYGTNQLAYAPNYPASPWRVGGAVIGGASVPASIIAFLSFNPKPPPQPPLPEPAPYTVAAIPLDPQPVATTPPIAVPLELEHAPEPRPKAPPGKVVIELRTQPAGIDVYDGKLNIGKTPMWVTISNLTRPCTKQGTCPGGRCVAQRCESTKKLILRDHPGERTIELGPSDAPLVEIH